LIAFEREDVLLGDVALTTHGIDAHDRALDGQQIQQIAMISLDFSATWTARGAGAPRRPSHVDRGFRAFLLVGAPQGLAIEGDHISRRPGQCSDPSDEAALEFLGVERREDVAQVIMRGSTVAKWPEPTQKIKLLLVEPGNVDERLGSRQHREQTQKQDLLERIEHLAGLARVRQIPEMIQKGKCPEFRRRIRHHNPPPVESEDHDRFMTLRVCHALPSPDCPEGYPGATAKRQSSSRCFRIPVRAIVEVASPLYGERNVVLRYRVCDRLWRPAGRLVRFVAVIHPTRGSCLLMCTDLSLSAIEIIHLYGLRFKIEHNFKQATRLIGAFAYHFWMMDMTPLRYRNRNRNQHLPESRYAQDARLSRLHSGKRRRPRSAAVSRPRCSQACLGLIRLEAGNHSSGHPAIRIYRSQRSAADASRLSPRFPGKRFSREIHRRSARHWQHEAFPHWPHEH
jgi:hypothetical protein